MAQSPGGVSANLSMWLKADASSTLSSTDSLNSWTYFNNGSNVFTAPAGNRPRVVSSALNFLPAVAFNGGQFMRGPAGVNAPLDTLELAYSVFAVWSSSVVLFGPSQRIWNERPDTSDFDGNFDGTALWVYQGEFYGDQPEVNPFTQGATLNYTVNTPYLSEMTLLNQNTNDLVMTDQTNLSTGGVTASTDPSNNATVNRKLNNSANLLGARDTVPDEPFSGNLSELIVYKGPVTGAAQSQVFSYLSLKYGIPTNTSLYSSASATTPVWDNTALSGAYNTDVFGLGQDNGSGLLNTQSNSSATGTGNGTGISGKGNVVLSSPSSLTDQNFLIVGNNNAGFAESSANLPTADVSNGSLRLAQQWLVQNTGNVGTLTLSFDFTGITTTGVVGTSSDFRLLVDKDGDGDFTTGSQEYYQPTSWNGNVASFAGISLTESSNVVFAIMSSAATGTPLPVNWTSFTATPDGNNVDLNWGVSANEDGKVYEVQHSTDGVSFTTIGEVANVASIESYSFVHVNAGAGKHYYRIQEVDIDGKSIYSKIVSVIINGADFSVHVLNNPVVGSVPAQIEIDAVKGGNATIEVWTVGGIKVATIAQFVSPGSNRVSLPLGSLPSMSYAVKVSTSDGSQVVQVVKL